MTTAQQTLLRLLATALFSAPLTLPEEGTIAVDLSAIDFASRETPVRILAYGGFTADMVSKFSSVMFSTRRRPPS